MTNPDKKPQSIDEYIAFASPESAKRLREMLACLRKAAPKAEESIKWGKPALSYQTILFIFAATKKHISLHPTPAAIKTFSKELAEFKTTSATIQFPLQRPIPSDLVYKIAEYRVRQVLEHQSSWM